MQGYFVSRGSSRLALQLGNEQRANIVACLQVRMGHWDKK